MKKAIITISILIGLCGCMWSQYMFTKNYIAGYFEYDNAYTQVDKNAYIEFFFGGEHGNDCISYHNYNNKAQYSVYAEKFGDTSYNRVLDYINDVYPSNTRVLSFIVTSIDIVSDADWNESHGAGTSLAQYFSVKFRSIAQFIDSGYDFELEQYCENHWITTPLDELQEDDMRLVIFCRPSFEIYATTPPTIDKHHRLTITLTLDDGSTKEHTVEVTYP